MYYETFNYYGPQRKQAREGATISDRCGMVLPTFIQTMALPAVKLFIQGAYRTLKVVFHDLLRLSLRVHRSKMWQPFH